MTTTSTPPTKTNAPADTNLTNRAWFEDGVVYVEYRTDCTLAAALEMQRRTTELILEHKLSVAPLVIIFTPTSKFKMKLSEFGKTGSSDMLKHVSMPILVSSEDSIGSKMIDIAAKLFLNNRLKTTKSVEEARKIAQSYRHDDLAMLEHS